MPIRYERKGSLWDRLRGLNYTRVICVDEGEKALYSSTKANIDEKIAKILAEDHIKDKPANKNHLVKVIFERIKL